MLYDPEEGSIMNLIVVVAPGALFSAAQRRDFD